MSSSIDHLVAVNAPVERRFYPRITPSVPIYVAFGPNNLGTLLNVSENGFQVVTPSRLDQNSVYRVFLSLDGISRTITVSVRTIWTADSQNSSGIQLLDLSDEDRQQIRDWIALQTSQNESMENWFTPKSADPLPGTPDSLSSEAAEPPPSLESSWSVPVESSLPPLEPPSPAAVTEPPAAVARPTEHEFPPMPLPIHGDFTYEPPTDRERKILRRRERKSRSRSRSPISGPILWTLFMLVICAAVGWPFRQKLSDLLLHLPEQFAKESARPADTNPPVAAPDAPAPPATTEATSGADAVTREADRNAAATSINAGAPSAAPAVPTTAEPKLVPPAVVATRHAAPKVSASKPNLDSIPNRSDRPEAPEVSRSYVADSAPLLTAASDARPPRVPTPDPAPATTVSSAPGPAPRTNTASTPAPAAIRPPVDAQTSRRSAITGSISNSSASAPLVAQQPSTVRSNSFEARNSNPSNSASNSAPANSAVIQMDVADARVIEVSPPRNLTGNLTASYVNLPGERVLRSGSLTMHIARSVRIPGDRIPGERWIWRGHKKVVLGELESRVDPQVSQLPVPYGSITVLATIDKDGYVSNVKPLYGFLAFLPNVAGALRNWRYQTTYLDNKPAETQAQIEIDFRPPATTRASRP